MSAELYLREKQLAYDLAYVRAEIKEHAAYKRLHESEIAISVAKQFLTDSYEWHQKVLAVKDTLDINTSYSENNLEMARAKVRSAINRRKRALRALNKVRYPTPLPHQPEPEAAKESKGCDVWCETCCQCPPPPLPENTDTAWLDAWVNGLPPGRNTDVPTSPPEVYRMSEDTKDKLAAAFGWTGREKEGDDNYWFEDKTGGQSEMAKNIEEIRGLLHNHTRLEAVKGVGTECYEEKDSNYWFELWEEGMQSGMRGGEEDEEVTKTQQEREEEEEKMEEMRAIWEDRRMIKRL
jgi:hypothetical protein